MLEVAILGAGMSGLCMAVQLRRAGITAFSVLEQQHGLGGTWWDNRYPGAHVDVPAPLYSFSFAPNPHWRERFAAAPEIQAYMQALAEREGVLPHIRFGQRLVHARWDGDAACWRLRTGGGLTLAARHLVCSTGSLNQPRWPDIDGLASFAGQRLHSARWDAAVPLAGRRVGVIGTGSTASQLVPELAKATDPTMGGGHLTVFQRTANWVLPRMDRRYGTLDRTLARLPPYNAAVRAFWFWLLELGRKGFDDGHFVRRGMLATARRHLAKQVRDPALRAKLAPPYPFGCKRIIYSNDYFPALTRPNVTLETAAIERVVPDGIVTADGRTHPLDVLVCATGFDTVRPLASLAIQGADGRTLAERWGDAPEAWFGTLVAGFPNLHLMLGPNTGTGHTSTLLFIEPEVRHALACIRRVRDEGKAWITVRPEVQAAHNTALQARLHGSVWTHCRSWYRNEAGRVFALWPGFVREYRRALERADPAGYELG